MSIKVCDSIMGTGKAQPLSAQVLTDTGFRDMGSIAVGDRVYCIHKERRMFIG